MKYLFGLLLLLLLVVSSVCAAPALTVLTSDGVSYPVPNGIKFNLSDLTVFVDDGEKSIDKRELVTTRLKECVIKFRTRTGITYPQPAGFTYVLNTRQIRISSAGATRMPVYQSGFEVCSRS